MLLTVLGYPQEKSIWKNHSSNFLYVAFRNHFFLLALYITYFKQIIYKLIFFFCHLLVLERSFWHKSVALFGVIGIRFRIDWPSFCVSCLLLLERSQRGEKVSYSHRHSIPSLKKYPCGKILGKSLALPREYQNSQQTSKGVT